MDTSQQRQLGELNLDEIKQIIDHQKTRKQKSVSYPTNWLIRVVTKSMFPHDLLFDF